jgi:2-polyprenyl-3-methyl-5-hydroxy-6-metoxy-1,4-benzoquinol methylase
MDRRLEKELLDGLEPTNADAQRARADLRRLNRIMNHAQVFARELRRSPCVKRLCDLGGGDATLMLAVARRIGWRDVDLTVVDQHDTISEETRAAFMRFGWKLTLLQEDVSKVLSGTRKFDAVTANLFLHHFSNEQLAAMFSNIIGRTALFVGCEPRRNKLALAASRMVGVIGCNRVTQNDAVISVRAGFAGQELSALWPAGARWDVSEHRSGLFSHLFVAQRM